MSATPLVVRATRDDVVESMHHVDVVIVGARGEHVAIAGNPETVAYLRSSAKPIQAATCVELGWEPPGEEQLAVACASHNGSPAHTDAVRATLAAAGLGEDALRCPVEGPSRLNHNCSGKHAAMVATCVANGWDLATYLEGDSEIQRAIRARIELIAETPARRVGIDGCGVPTFAFTLRESATLFARLPAEAGRALAAMMRHPYLVAGSNRICTAVMTRMPDVVLKIGAEGLMCGVLVGSGIAFALKARDGAARGREIATLFVLEHLGVLDPEASQAVRIDIEPRVRTGQGRQPELRCVGSLDRA